MNRKYKDKIEVKEWFREWFKRRTIFQDTCFTCEAGSLQWIITEKGKFKPCVVLPEEKELEFTEDFFVDYLNLKKEIKWNRYYSKLNEYCICEHMKPKDFCDRIKEPIKE